MELKKIKIFFFPFGGFKLLGTTLIEAIEEAFRLIITGDPEVFSIVGRSLSISGFATILACFWGIADGHTCHLRTPGGRRPQHRPGKGRLAAEREQGWRDLRPAGAASLGRSEHSACQVRVALSGGDQSREPLFFDQMPL